jgi:ABC-type transport system involved in multi-copper enzyme maturation permease subunit
MNSILLIAAKEWKDIYRSKMFMAMLFLLVTLTIISISVSFAVFDAQLSEYNA